MKVKLRSHEMQKYKWNSKISTMMLEKSHLGYFSWNDKTGIFFHFFFQSLPFILQCVEDKPVLLRIFCFLQLTLIIQNNFENKTPWKNSYTLERHYNETF